MAAKIPQDVTREDRLIGPLTLKQFLYLLAGGAIIFIAYQYYSRGWLFLIEFLLISFVAGSLTVALAFAKINGIAFGVFMLQLFRFLTSPKNRIWFKDESSKMPVEAHEAKTTKEEDPAEKHTTESQLQLLAQVLDTGGKMNENSNVDTNRIGNIGTDVTPVEKPVVEDVLAELDE